MGCPPFKTHSLTQKPAHKDHKCNAQSPAITLVPTYAPVSKRSGSRSL
ncbi:transcriptional regulator [Lacticaseibacillus paracasei]|uniref:Transcriptional regulator n=1 Tax=Lacticaseibacillus paracasei TaxID=1597 RepID=A0ABD7BTM0_LACPA|nr:transcriptional regulator [Lacticaseibacillus paracasei]